MCIPLENILDKDNFVDVYHTSLTLHSAYDYICNCSICICSRVKVNCIEINMILSYHEILAVTARRVLTFATGEMLALSCFSGKVSRSLHQLCGICIVILIHRWHCVVSLSKTDQSLLSTVQPRKARPDITVKLLTGT